MTLSKAKQGKRNALLTQNLKECSRCHQIKSIFQFTVRRSKSDGLSSQCKTCQDEYRKQYRADPEKREMERRSSRDWKLNHAERDKEVRELWDARNRDKKRKLKTAWHRKHKESENAKARERMKQWVAENAEQHRNNNHLRRSREAGSDGSYTLEQWEHLLSFFNGICPRCGQKRKLTRDHIIPLKWGGSTYISNLQPICKQCNSEKGDHAAVDYRPPLARAWAYLESIPWQPVIADESLNSPAESLTFTAKCGIVRT